MALKPCRNMSSVPNKHLLYHIHYDFFCYAASKSPQINCNYQNNYHIPVLTFKYLERKTKDHQKAKFERNCLSSGELCQLINDFTSSCLHMLNSSDGRKKIAELLPHHTKQEHIDSRTNYVDLGERGWEGQRETASWCSRWGEG